MPVGFPVNAANINNQAGMLAVQLRDWARNVANLYQPVIALGADDAARRTALTALGYTAGDAQTILYLVEVLNTVAQVYYGNASQTPPFNFDNALSTLWGMR